MSNILSYSLFDQKGDKFNRSGHDPLDRKPNRYWLNLPFILMLNNTVFPTFKTRLYVPKKLEENQYYPILEKFNELDNFELVKVNKDYFKTEPAIWRIMPLWDNDIDFCFCRDLDSVFIRKEVQAMIYFMKSGLMIHNIRSTYNHNGEGTSIMAGLCGFDVKKLKPGLPMPESFEKYMDFYKSTTNVGVWGCDQETLLNFFLRYRGKRIENQILDTYILAKKGLAKTDKVYKNKFYNMVSISEEIYNNIKLAPHKERALLLSNETTAWAGQPVDASGKYLKNLASVCNNKHSQDVIKIINSSKKYKNLFGI